MEYLQQLGFSQYEAQAYLTLLRQNPLNGYELAKASGIPRPNIYPVLQKLEERGAVLRLDTPDGVRYAPVEPEELLAKLKQRYQKMLNEAECALQAVAAPVMPETVLNLRRYPALLDHARALLDKTRHDLLLSVWPEEAAALAGAVEQASERGVAVTTLCLRGCPQPCPACRGAVFRYPIAPAQGGRWLALVSDAQELLAGQITGQGEAQAVRTRQKMLVNLTGGYILNSIALAAILSDLGGRLETTLQPPTLEMLNALHPMQEHGPWLEVMRRMLHARPPAAGGDEQASPR